MDTSETFDINSCYVPTTGTCTYTPSYWSWNSSPDKGMQAYNVIKALVNKKLVECKSASQFMALMDEVIQAL